MFKDGRGKVIYIGKAKSLKKRVASYFNRPLDTKTQAMVSRSRDLEYRLTDTEAQARILEAALVKDIMPQYNIDLKDDKSFPLVKITAEEFPIVSIARQKDKSKDPAAQYFGPYPDAKLLRQAFKLMRRIFGFRSCRLMPKAECLYGRIKLCPAPCAGKIDARRYREIIERIKLFLDSRYDDLLNNLSLDMREASAQRDFEQAAGLRDQINALAALSGSSSSKIALSELEGLQQLLKLKKLPQRIEAFDISNISGCEATGSMVSFWRGMPDKNNYRRFRIKTVERIDDYAMLAEVVERRYRRVIKENLAQPDLVLIDGGRQHLLTALRQLKALGLNLALASIAKDRENIYTQGRRNPIRLKQDTLALNLIRRVRDEAHRFAVSYHHLLRRKKIIGK